MSGRPAASAWARRISSRTPCIDTRCACSLIDVSSAPTARPCCRSTCSAQALTLPLLHDIRTVFEGIWMPRAPDLARPLDARPPRQDDAIVEEEEHAVVLHRGHGPKRIPDAQLGVALAHRECAVGGARLEHDVGMAGDDLLGVG